MKYQIKECVVQAIVVSHTQFYIIIYTCLNTLSYSLYT
nr:MAG TPA: hypothetical protein [Caudoviricetes sp.]